jgi:hypothetical protein
VEIFTDLEQNTEAWLRARAGIPTASQFSKVLAKGEGKTRREYLLKLAGEIITGRPMESFSNEHTERGHEQEPEARDLYAFQTGAQLERVGFIKDGRKGASPDCLIGDDGGAEVKTRLAHLQADLILKGEVPTTHTAQIQGTLWVSRRKWWDFVSYCPGMPLFVKRVQRDERYIQSLATEVDRFNVELDEVVSQIRRRSGAMAA